MNDHMKFGLLAGVLAGFITTLAIFGATGVVGNHKAAQRAIAECEKNIPRYMTCKITAEIKEVE